MAERNAMKATDDKSSSRAVAAGHSKAPSTANTNNRSQNMGAREGGGKQDQGASANQAGMAGAGSGDNVRVAVRVRPPLDFEIKAGNTFDMLKVDMQTKLVQ